MTTHDDMASDPTISPSSERYCPGCDSSFPASIDRCPTDGTSLIELVSDDSLIGADIDGRFTIKRKLGSGGMGSAYAAVQHSMGRDVAIKVIHAHLSRDRQSAKRFLRETKLASELSHPNTVTVLDFGQTADRRLYMVMELIRGNTLTTVLKIEQRLEPARVIEIGLQICDAMEAAHRLHIVHRDLKPSNIMLEDRGGGRDFVKVLDFGLAKSLTGDETTVTESNAIMGTPQYIPPELAIGARADGRADLYSLGAVLYELVSGRPIFEGETVQAVLFRQVHEPPPPLPDDVPGPLAAVIMKLLAKKVENRFQTATATRDALRAVRDGRDPGIGRPRDPNAVAVTIDPDSARVVAVTQGLTETLDSKWSGPDAPAIAVAAREVALDAAKVAVADQRPGVGRRIAPKIAWVLVPVVVAAGAALFVLKGSNSVTTQSPGGSSGGGISSGSASGTDTDRRNEKPDDVVERKRDKDVDDDPVTPLDQQRAREVTIEFTSTPSGAAVRTGEAVLCETPCKKPFDLSADGIELTFTRAGFKSVTRTVTPDEDREVNVKLKRKKRQRRERQGDPKRQDIGDFDSSYD